VIEIASGDVHIWHASLHVPEWRLPEYQQYLSPDERERADRYVMPIHRGRFSVGRTVLRDVLSRYSNIPPHGLIFNYGQQGKPEFKQMSDIHFNLAHSEDRLVIGITRGQAVGIDIERVRSLPDMEQLSQRFLPALEGLYRDEWIFRDQRTAFFQRWTRTEALLKAMGTGIPGLQKLDEPDLARWTIREIDAPPGYIAALAVEGEINRIKRMEL
jgi:4'-phosphopantetheinyl transferase